MSVCLSLPAGSSLIRALHFKMADQLYYMLCESPREALYYPSGGYLSPLHFACGKNGDMICLDTMLCHFQGRRRDEAITNAPPIHQVPDTNVCPLPLSSDVDLSHTEQGMTLLGVALTSDRRDITTLLLLVRRHEYVV